MKVRGGNEERLDRNLRVADRLALVVLAPERGSGSMAVVTLSHDVDGLLARRSLCPTFSVIVPHALGSRAFVLGVKQKKKSE